MYKVVRKSEGTLRKIAANKTALNLITKDISPGVSLSVQAAADYVETETTEYDRIYFLLSGSLELDFGDDIHTLEVGDSCYISKTTNYTMRGTYAAVVVNQPAFGSKA